MQSCAHVVQKVKSVHAWQTEKTDTKKRIFELEDIEKIHFHFIFDLVCKEWHAYSLSIVKPFQILAKLGV